MTEVLGKLYGRKWKICVYKKGETKDSDMAMDVSNLKCTFKLERKRGQPVTLCTLVIYNMNQTTEKEIIEAGFQISIEAGYEQAQYGEIYTGDIIQVIRNRENVVDYKLEILALEGSEIFDGNFVAATCAANSKPRDVIDTVAKKANNKIEVDQVTDKISKQPLPRGKVLFGTPTKYLREMSIWNNAWFKANKGKLKLCSLADEVKEDEVLQLSPTTGLVGAPKYTDKGIIIKCLLDSRIKLETMIKIDNELIQKQLIAYNSSNPSQNNQPDQKTMFDQDGEYSVISLTHSGDTWGDEWFTEVVALSRGGAATLLDAMQDDKTNMRV